jgi:SAM-dependent methyltransferase
MSLAITGCPPTFIVMTDWQERYLQGDTPWDKGRPAPPLEELIGRLGPGLFGEEEVWVPGCGAGHDVRLLASHGLRVLGLDLAPAALDAARSHAAVNDERYELMDFLDAGQREGREAGAIWEHTCYCAIDPSRRADYARSCAELLAPGRVLAGVFFLRPWDEGEEHQGPPFGAMIESIDACFSPWFERLEAWVPLLGYPGREGREWLAVYKRL